MHTFRQFAQRHAQASAWLLALALLLSAAWGQVHRVLHAGVPTHTQVLQLKAPVAHALGKVAVSPQGLADEEGSSLCQLLDQLALGAGATAAQVSDEQVPPPVRQVLGPVAPVILAVAGRRFDARGPPAST